MGCRRLPFFNFFFLVIWAAGYGFLWFFLDLALDVQSSRTSNIWCYTVGFWPVKVLNWSSVGIYNCRFMVLTMIWVAWRELEREIHTFVMPRVWSSRLVGWNVHVAVPLTGTVSSRLVVGKSFCIGSVFRHFAKFFWLFGIYFLIKYSQRAGWLSWTKVGHVDLVLILISYILVLHCYIVGLSPLLHEAFFWKFYL